MPHYFCEFDRIDLINKIILPISVLEVCSHQLCSLVRCYKSRFRQIMSFCEAFEEDEAKVRYRVIWKFRSVLSDRELIGRKSRNYRCLWLRGIIPERHGSNYWKTMLLNNGLRKRESEEDSNRGKLNFENFDVLWPDNQSRDRKFLYRFSSFAHFRFFFFPTLYFCSPITQFSSAWLLSIK